MDPAPATRRLPEIPQEVSSAPSGSIPPRRRGWNSTLDFRMSTLAIFAMCNVLLLCLAFIGGRSSVPEPPPLANPAVVQSDDPPWPMLSPEPSGSGADLRNILDSEGEPVEISAASTEDSSDSEDLPLQVAEPDPKMYVVMVGQKLSAELEVIDQLLKYVDSGLTEGVSRVRVKQQRSGFKRYDVYVGPFKTKEESRRTLSQLMDLRPTLGIRFADSYISSMEFTPEELRALDQ